MRAKLKLMQLMCLSKEENKEELEYNRRRKVRNERSNDHLEEERRRLQRGYVSGNGNRHLPSLSLGRKRREKKKIKESEREMRKSAK